MIKIEEFIGRIRDLDIELEYACMNGNCYRFAKLLHKTFKPSQILIYNDDDFGHCIVKYKNKYYDVRGEFKGSLEGYHIPTKEDIIEAKKWRY